MLKNLFETTEGPGAGKLPKRIHVRGCKATEIAFSNARVKTSISKRCLKLDPSLPVRIHGHSDCVAPSDLHNLSGFVPCPPTHSLYPARRPHDVDVNGTLPWELMQTESVKFRRQLRCTYGYSSARIEQLSFGKDKVPSVRQFSCSVFNSGSALHVCIGAAAAILATSSPAPLCV